MHKINQAEIQQYADALADEGWFVIQDFVDEQFSKQLLEIVSETRFNQNFRRAGIGAGADYQLNNKVRGDFIHWISPHPSEPVLQEWINVMTILRSGLNRELFLGLQDIEMHMAIYPSGTFYQRHLDQFNERSNRIISVVLYLNQHWEPGMGGELVIYRDAAEPVTVDPHAGTLVCFLSDKIEHEVMQTHVERFSITGWMLRKPVGLGFL
ncbi:MAG: 2OG-Fe(II) oxygenase [Bacteroidales bacterium]|nr:2OG-Fe(II) oxygenase [Bacteroidales bacterium]HOI32731.1 2OG-Fe(II) oxygenase [Bacteroidales bacterium]